MSQSVIKVEDLGKLYRLGEIGTGTISHDLNRWWARLRGKEDPFVKVSEVNDRTQMGNSDYVWALKNINFEVRQGEVLGIIGRNGAGKSTLLKILSKVTTPTKGNIKIKGRIASLLEVGTGFHPELTGRENIFLNGAILGMTKAEIKSKFDEIVDFAGVERYVDTPVKRYSSGMYVRLAFAVAAFLEPEILIVDEVLAVGDYEFQERCIGKMKSVSQNQGRTVLFVSHNISIMKSLCDSGILLNKGIIEDAGSMESVAATYQSFNINRLNHFAEWDDLKTAPGNSIVRIKKVGVRNSEGSYVTEVDITEDFYLEMQYEVFQNGHVLWNSFNLYDSFGCHIFDTHSTSTELYNKPHEVGSYTARVKIPGNFLNEGDLVIGCAIFNHSRRVVHTWLKEIIHLKVVDKIFYPSLITARGQAMGSFEGTIRPLLNWEIDSVAPVNRSMQLK